jgi:hypothetical protein
MTKNKFSGGKSQIKFVLLLSILFLFLAFFVLSLSKTSERADAKTSESVTDSVGTSELDWFEDDSAGTSQSTDGQEFEAGNNGKVFLEGEFLDHDILKITAKISDIETPVLGLAFHLKYDHSLLSFLRYDPGDFLERGGDPFYLVSGGKAEETGEIIYGETLRRDASFPVGEGIISVFYFQQIATDVKYEFHFFNGVVSTLDTVRQDISGIKFIDLVLGTEEVADQNGIEDVFGDNVLGSLEDGGDDSSNGGFYGTLSFWLFVAVFISIGCATFYFVKSYLAKSKFRNKICDLP